MLCRVRKERVNEERKKDFQSSIEYEEGVERKKKNNNSRNNELQRIPDVVIAHCVGDHPFPKISFLELDLLFPRSRPMRNIKHYI